MKKLTVSLLAFALICSMSNAFAANTGGEKHYEIDLEAVDEKTWNDSAVDIQMYVNGQNSYLRRDGITCADRGEGYQQYDEKDLGFPVLFRYDPNGKQDENSMNITFIPLRKIAQVLGCPIDWNDKTKNVVLDTPKGRIEFPINATSVTAPDGTTFSEETYKFPNGENINIVAVRDNRTYVTVRFISSFMMPDATYKWKGTERLTVTGTIEKATTTEKTPGVNMNYYNPGNGSMDWTSMPNLMAALEGKDWAIPNLDRPGLTQEGVFLYTKSGRVSQTLAITYVYDSTGTNKVLKISGFHGTQMYVEQLPVIEGALKDLVCDADRASIIELLNKIADNSSPGFTMEKGATAEAIEWVKNQPKEYSFKEVKVSADEWLTDFTITTK